MKKVHRVLLTVGAVLFVLFVLLPLTFAVFDGEKFGNVAKIPIDGVITSNGGSSFGQSFASAKEIVKFIESADKDKQVQIIVLEINSPGGSAVASDEIAAAVKKVKKPVVAHIRELGASGGYWIASASDYIIANRMSITGSIGVISSYLEFSGLMEEYGIGYQQLTSGKYKDAGTPFRKLTSEEENLLQKKLDRIHDFFIEEVANNRKLSEKEVRDVATGEFYLGVEAKALGLVDELGGKEELESYLKKEQGLKEIDYLVFEKQLGLFDLFAQVFGDFSFLIGKGIGSNFIQNNLIKV